MKKNYKIGTLLLLLLCLFTFKQNAQISGVVTINSGAATAGTNYQTFNALATVLNTSGINGTLVVNVVASTGPYIEQVQFNTISGVSATNTITINGNGNTITFNSTNFSMPWIVQLNGADRMNFNNLSMIGTGPNAYCAHLTNGADYNNFTACTFSVPANSTSSNQFPVVFSASQTSYSSFGNSGNYNKFLNCIMRNGFYGVSMYGNFSSPWITDNVIENCSIQDFYRSGIYAYYCKNTILKNNVIERPTRTNWTTTYGIWFYYQNGGVCDGNRVQRLYDGTGGNTNTSQCFGIYAYWNSANGGGTNRNTIRNNIISNINHNGTLYGLYAPYIDGYIYHNTISLDNTTSTSGSSTYGLYAFYTSGYDVTATDNIISISRGGTGLKYGLYITSGVNSNFNNIFMNAAGGTNYVGYYTGNATNLAALQTQGTDANSTSLNPQYTSIAGFNYIPTNASLNNLGTPVGVASDINFAPRSGTVPDMGAHEFLSVQCAGTPSANAVSPATITVCPGESIELGVANYYSDLGITYQWQTSTTSSVGPFTSVPGATNVLYTTPSITNTTYYSIVMTCTNGNGNISPVGIVNVAGTTTNTVPYYEDFEGINSVNKLPNCSWTSNSLGVNALTYTSTLNQNRSANSGSKYAAFYGYYITGTNYFYTNAMQLNAGVTYSASLFYKTEYYGYTNFTDLSILVGPNQNTTGLVPVASSNGVATSLIYKPLSNTFTVATSGLYYVAVAATSNGQYGAFYLSWDDLRIDVPCDINSPTVSLSASTQTICKGDVVNLTAVGADDYLWSTGDTGPTFTNSPSNNTTYYVVATSTLSGCSVTLQSNVIVNDSPIIIAHASTPSICAGQSANITAIGALTYTWSTSSTNQVITVSPNSTTSYTVLGSNANNCQASAVAVIIVNPNPTVTSTSNAPDPNQICPGEQITLTGGGASTYVWSASSIYITGNPVLVSPLVTTTYSLTGTNAGGCSATTLVVLNVGECTGIAQLSANSNALEVFPNPTNNELTIKTFNSETKSFELTDLSGRVVYSGKAADETTQINMKTLANGVYYLKVQTNTSTEVVKIIKN